MKKIKIKSIIVFIIAIFILFSTSIVISNNKKERLNIVKAQKERIQSIDSSLDTIDNDIYSENLYFKKYRDEIIVYIKSPYNEKYTEYVFRNVLNESINYNSWRILDIFICNDKLKRLYSLSPDGGNIECEGALKEYDAVDFIGGYHGDEYCRNINILVDGIELNNKNTVKLSPANEVVIKVLSTLTRCNTDEPVFDRERINTFSKDGLKIENQFTATSDIDIQYAALSLLAIKIYNGNDKIITEYKSNVMQEAEKITSFEENVTFGKSNEFTFAELIGDIYASVEMTDYLETSNDNARGQFTYFKDGRIKIYEYPVIKQSYKKGDMLKCTSIQKVYAYK